MTFYRENNRGERYDVWDKLGFLEATIDFALKRPELREGLIEFLKDKFEKANSKDLIKEVAYTVE